MPFVKNARSAFSDASSFESNGLEVWDVSHATNFSSTFFRAVFFKGDLSSWNASTVTNMEHMFSEAGVFVRDLSRWDATSVLGFQGIFNEHRSSIAT